MSESTPNPTPIKANNVNGERQRLMAAVTAKSELYKHQVQLDADRALTDARQAAHQARQKADDDLGNATRNSIGAFYALFEGQFDQLDYTNGSLLHTLQGASASGSSPSPLSCAIDVQRNLRFTILGPEKDTDSQVTEIVSVALNDFELKDQKQLYHYDPSQNRKLPTADSAIAIDPTQQTLFWIDSAGCLYTAGYDGANPTARLQIDRAGGEPCSLAVDTKRQLLYCLEPSAIWQIAIGTWSRSLHADPSLYPKSHEAGISTAAIAVNEPTGYVYWSFGGDIIETDNHGVSLPIVVPPHGCLALAIEPTSHTLYWVNGALSRSSTSIDTLEKQLSNVISQGVAGFVNTTIDNSNTLGTALGSLGSALGSLGSSSFSLPESPPPPDPQKQYDQQVTKLKNQLEKAKAKAFQYQIHRLYLGNETAEQEFLGKLPSFRTRQIFVVSSYDEAKLQLAAAKHAKAHDLKTASQQEATAQSQAAASRHVAQLNYQTAHDNAAQSIRNAQVNATQQRNVAKRQLESQRTQARQTKAAAQGNYQQRLDDAHRDYSTKVANAHQKAAQITSAAHAKLRDAQSKR